MPQIHWVPGSFAQRGPTSSGQGRTVGEVGGGPGFRYVSSGAMAAQGSTSGTQQAEVEIGFSEQFEIQLDPGQTECTLWALGLLLGTYFARSTGSWGLSTGTAVVDCLVKAKVLEGNAEIITFDYPITARDSSSWGSGFDGDHVREIHNKQRQVQATDIYTLDINAHLLTKASVSIRYFNATAEGNVIFPPPGAMTLLFVR